MPKKKYIRKKNNGLANIASITTKSISNAISNYRKKKELEKIKSIKLSKLSEKNEIQKERKELKNLEEKISK